MTVISYGSPVAWQSAQHRLSIQERTFSHATFGVIFVRSYWWANYLILVSRDIFTWINPYCNGWLRLNLHVIMNNVQQQFSNRHAFPLNLTPIYMWVSVFENKKRIMRLVIHHRHGVIRVKWFYRWLINSVWANGTFPNISINLSLILAWLNNAQPLCICW